jgi:2-dehydro-3-deoxy-L-rhamnonate dehydrogenase (NAD+)
LKARPRVASVAGREGSPGVAAHAAAKAGATGFGKALAREAVGSGILVDAIAPASRRPTGSGN